MVGTAVGTIVLLATLAAFAAVGLSTRTRALDVEAFTVARGSQGAGALGLSFLASGLGAWILFAPPQVAAQLGVVAGAGYAVGAAVPIALMGPLGTRLRRIAPAGASLTGFARARFGRAFSVYVVGVSVLYMLLFVTAELTGIASVVAIIAGVEPRLTVLAIAGVTLAYTAYAGLPASLRTDRWQAWLILGLLLAGGAAMLAGDARGAQAPADVLQVDVAGLEAAVALVLAVGCANLFHQGYWQRVWAARDSRALRRGAWLGAATSAPMVALVAALGLLAAARGVDLGSPPAPFFVLLTGLPAWVGLGVLVLGVALVCSSVDTLENGLAALVTAERPSLPLSGARWATLVLMVPAVLLALQGYDVLRLFLIADLLCAATAAPALLGLWHRATGPGALAGAVAGLAGALGAGALAGGSLTEGLTRVTFPLAAPTLPEFAGALVASTAVTVVVSLAGRRSTDLDAVGAAVAAQRTPQGG